MFSKTALDMNPRKQVHKGNESHKSVSALMKVCHQCAGFGGVLEGFSGLSCLFPKVLQGCDCVWLKGVQLGLAICCKIRVSFKA